jgi:hypothetical protein
VTKRHIRIEQPDSGKVVLWDGGEQSGVFQPFLIPLCLLDVPQAIDSHLVDIPGGLVSTVCTVEAGWVGADL